MVAGCADPTAGPVAPAAERPTLARAAAGASATPTDRHVFLMNREAIPAGFAAAVAAAGGEVVRLHDEIGVAVVRGLSDEAAHRVA